MNKQELASLIWDYCNGLRGSISTVEYKDFILGFIFYRFLSEKEVEHLRKQHWTDDNMKEYLNESDQDTVEECKNNLGYFIEYKDLFSTWKSNESFDISNVSEALDRFTRNIDSNHLTIYDGIFKSLSDKLPKLGTGNEAKSHIRKIVNIVCQIPMDGKQGYDVLGFIYEYLLANFASNAGKKDGEFYTPHEISLLMSEIVAEHLKDRDTINIFDPTSGSGSLLINIGQSIQKYMHSSDNVAYYAQEKIEDTYNLTRMNLIMRGVKPGNIFVRCADTLAVDWPYIDYNDCYKYVPVDCVVSNPPYSQKWDAEAHENDPRYRSYGIAPAGKADYAFLLHDLYHLKNDGIMCIVLPHGVLFRGGTEKEIRQNLIENNNIETIIGLPANIFYGTGIPTIIMVLKKQRSNGDILFIDASKEFYKDGSKNKLAGHNIKKIVDTVLERKSIPYFSKLINKETVQQNDYNLNIPRYIISKKEEMPFDINCTMYGNLPISEIDQFNEWWDAFPKLRTQLFENVNIHTAKVIADSLKNSILSNSEVREFIDDFKTRFDGFDNELFEILLNKESKNIQQLKTNVTTLIFNKCEGLKLIDKYQVFKAFDEAWTSISIDIEMISTNKNLSICKEVEDIEVYDKKNKVTVTKGQQGKIIPFDLIKKVLYSSEFDAINAKVSELSTLESEYLSIFEEMDEEIKAQIKKEDSKEVEIDSKLLKAKYNEYFKKGTNTYNLSEDDAEYKYKILFDLNSKISVTKKEIKQITKDLDEKIVKRISLLSDNEIKTLLKEKWVNPVISEINKLTTNLVDDFVSKLNKLIKKYESPLTNVNEELKDVELNLLSMLDELKGDEFDIQGLKEFKKMLGGE